MHLYIYVLYIIAYSFISTCIGFEEKKINFKKLNRRHTHYLASRKIHFAQLPASKYKHLIMSILNGISLWIFLYTTLYKPYTLTVT